MVLCPLGQRPRKTKKTKTKKTKKQNEPPKIVAPKKAKREGRFFVFIISLYQIWYSEKI
jgi:hypothetical protein